MPGPYKSCSSDFKKTPFVKVPGFLIQILYSYYTVDTSDYIQSF
jgi:hypothetical protein